MNSMLPTFLTNVIFGNEGGRNAGNEPVTTKSTDRGTINGGGMLSYAFSGMQGWRVSMEDAHMVATTITVEGKSQPLRKGHAMFGVMDGHGGDFTSGFAAHNFMRIFSSTTSLKKYASLSSEDQSNVPGIDLLKAALSETFTVLDREIRKRQNKRNDHIMTENNNNSMNDMPTRSLVRVERSGSTCVVVMVTPSHFLCANAGDSRAILRRGGKVLPLSFDHKPSNVPELERINAAGGFVKCKRVDGDLAVSRGLGDFSYKANESLAVAQQKVIPDPEFVVYPRDKRKDEFIVLGCDGIWDVASNEECSSFIQGLFDEGEVDLGLICEEAMDECLEKNSRDNMTISLITFDAAKMAQGALNERSAVWKRRAARQARHFNESAKLVATRAAENVGFSFASITGTEFTPSTSRKAVSVTAGSK